MRTINKITILFTLFVAVFQVGAQEIIPEKEPVKKEPVQQGRKRIDGIIATVGDYNILDSDIDKSFLEMASQGVSIKDFTRCQMLGKLMEEKLFAHQATQDSVVVKDEEIKNEPPPPPPPRKPRSGKHGKVPPPPPPPPPPRKKG